MGRPCHPAGPGGRRRRALRRGRVAAVGRGRGAGRALGRRHAPAGCCAGRQGGSVPALGQPGGRRRRRADAGARGARLGGGAAGLGPGKAKQPERGGAVQRARGGDAAKEPAQWHTSRPVCGPTCRHWCTAPPTPCWTWRRCRARPSRPTSSLWPPRCERALASRACRARESLALHAVVQCVPSSSWQQDLRQRCSLACRPAPTHPHHARSRLPPTHARSCRAWGAGSTRRYTSRTPWLAGCS